MGDYEENSDEDWEDYQSGPYCQHWSDPGDCDEICANCGRTWPEHYRNEGCGEWKDGP